ncbi:MAG TPA: SpvB/TcaC N-terminal domain-containing protein, partial [Chitinophagaceae bacterium]|nr:SpvB/TcaC N-terminal domain-containing protein [Chitinophagaceae bacterium]
MADYHENSTTTRKPGDENTLTSAKGILGTDKNFSIDIPNLTLPKSGGAIKGVDEKFEVNAVTGAASFSVPLSAGSARGFGVSLTVSYNSGAGNSVFGLGWGLSLTSIRRKTNKELPRYFDEQDSDTYIFSAAEDLVPKLKLTAGNWVPEENDSADGLFSIRQYRPRIEGAFARIERWTRKSDGLIHWRTISRDNTTGIFGDKAPSVIADPADPRKIFEWFLRFTYDDKGNCALYEYKQEDGKDMPSALHNKNRMSGDAPYVNTYLKRVKSGNIDPYVRGNTEPAPAQFLFETVLDYGEHDTVNIPFNAINNWTFRTDAFSEYQAGFEIRTCRLCKRVLLYHHFSELPGGSALVNTMNFEYDNNEQPGNFNFLKEITFTGYTKHDDNSYTQKSLPPLSFTYQKHAWNKSVCIPSSENIANAPAGIYDPAYQWVDLYSEGLNGILTEQADTLWYKQNLGAGNFSTALAVSPRPSFAGFGTHLQIVELEADGTKYLAGYTGENKGFFKIDDDNNWKSFKPFDQFPTIDDPDFLLIDLNGDGKQEILITDDNLFTWYPSLGEKGFEDSQKVWQSFDEEKGPRMLVRTDEQSIFLSDMNGDGLTDIVRIKNGSVCYWPSLGYGRFGAKISMDNAPVFDHPDQFNASLIKLSDIDGSGTTDIIYLGKQQYTIWLNQNGNGFLPEPQNITPFPGANKKSKISILDFLGTGTACIVYSSGLPAQREQPLRYIDIMGGKKPHLMVAYKNNMGLEVEWEFKPSTFYYIKDRNEGSPWVTKLPFPIHCLSKQTSYDRIMKTRFSCEYFYHHGYYDHAEREFRGFGRVDQKDAEDVVHFIKQSGGSLNNVIQEDLHLPPILVKTWYHTGAFLNGKKILDQFAHEYSKNSLHAENLLPEPELPTGLSNDEWRQALRACKGMMLRKEVYSLDGSILSNLPYTVDQQNCFVKMVQPKNGNKYASFLVMNSESISYQYERDLSDPRISHSFMLEADEFGNVKKTASVVYKRKISAFPEQDVIHAAYTENDFTNSIDTATDHRTPALYQAKAFVLTGMPTPVDYFTTEQIRTACATAAFIDYNVTPNGSLQKRLVGWNRLQFRNDNGTGILPFGVLQPKYLLHQTFKAIFNQAQLTEVFGTKISLADVNTILMNPTRGGYVFADNYYWIPSSMPQYDTAHFFQAISFSDPFGNTSGIQYDNKYRFFIQRATDALNNTKEVLKFNYRTLQPYLAQDVNDNHSAVRFDELGVVISSFTIGKKGIDTGDEFDDTRVEASTNDFPSSMLEYHAFEWFNQSTDPGFNIDSYKPKPNFLKTRTRETHYNAHPQHQTKWQDAYSYFGGTSQAVLTKSQAEPGPALKVNNDGTVVTIDTTPALRWIGNGRSILNNKGKSVKQYEPYFSTDPGFDDEKEMVELGVTAIMHYDPLGRPIRTDAPDKTFAKVQFTSWQQFTFDANDTVKDSEWYV